MARAAKRLSARAVETIAKPGYHADGDGLYLVVDKSGARRWAFIFHSQGKRREMGLGRIGLKEARDAADEVHRQIRSGIDPISTRRAARDNKASIPTFESLSREVIADAHARSANAKVRYQWELLLGSAYCGTILQKPINEITTLDIERILRPVWRSKPETGRKLLARLRRVFDYARVHLRDRHGITMLGNPAAWEDLRDRGFERITKLMRGRQAALDYEQVPAFVRAVQARPGIAARALEVTLLTGLRTGEVIGATWSEIDLERQIWVIPPERLKDRRTRTEPHRVPLSREVIEVLRALPRLSAYVFAGQRSGKPLSNMAMLTALKKMNRDTSGQPIWVDPKSGRSVTPHGFRATFRTWGEDVGFARELLEEALGHQIGSAVERAYRRTDSFERRRTVMQAWADFCCEKSAATDSSPINGEAGARIDVHGLEQPSE
ncbi:tyrosine-type recombinase/integrase [Methylobacterium nigriterrae]|uniref:tyrosine-type recombinase/integrase n=1 Tax=Methylobacterium nigriterrae TaxID=3127512 RepID=UPI003013806A